MWFDRLVNGIRGLCRDNMPLVVIIAVIVLVIWMIGYGLALQSSMVAVGSPGKLPDPALGQGLSQTQLWLVGEINDKLDAWLGLSNYFRILGLVGGSVTAALTVVIGLMKTENGLKMLLMAFSAAVSFMLGAVSPGEASKNYLLAWREIYSTAQHMKAKKSWTDDDLVALAQSLTNAEHKLGAGSSK